MDELTEEMRATKQRLAGLEQKDAWQPRLAMTPKHMDDIAAERVISGKNSSAQVDPDPMCLIIFGDDSIRPPALPCLRDDALVGNGTAASKPSLLPAEICSRTAAGGLRRHSLYSD